ncbi:MAG: YbgA family protein, partial [Acidobacteria bacterium]|nr:YbgA family protein [Acidobacteriota bacterium]
MTALSDLPRERPATPHDLVKFHARHKLLLMAHAPASVSALGRLVASAGTGDLVRIWSEYEAGFRSTLSMPPSRGGHVNALLHAVGYFRGVADEAKRRELARAIELYAAGASSLSAP